jgi:hypothetical protein
LETSNFLQLLHHNAQAVDVLDYSLGKLISELGNLVRKAIEFRFGFFMQVFCVLILPLLRVLLKSQY